MPTATQPRILNQVIDSVETTQARVLELNKRVAESLIDRFPTGRVRLPEVPGKTAVPALSEMVDNYFAFTSRLNEANHSFSRQLVDTWAVEEAKPAKKASTKS